MPIHDWTRVEAGLFHDFHHAWIEEIKRILNARILPRDYYAMAEQVTRPFGPDLLTLQSRGIGGDSGQSGGGVMTFPLSKPKAKLTVKTDADFLQRKKNVITIRHISDDEIVAIIEIVSPGNKASKLAFKEFTDKVLTLLNRRIHLLILDLFPPTRRDPHGVHSAIWEQIEADVVFLSPADKPLTLVAYEAGADIAAFIEPVAIGDILPNMPVILEPGGAVELLLEETYQSAFAAYPLRWRTVLEAPEVR